MIRFRRTAAYCLLVLPFATLALGQAPATNAEAAENSEIYLVPFSHLDLFWGGTREECLSRGNAIITKAVRQAQQSPQFRFLLEDNDFIANYLDSHRGAPEAEALKQMVRASRIEIAPKWAAIYQDLCDGEALARNLLIGKRYAREVFGMDPQVAHLGDIPGYTLQFPQLLAQAKVPFMVMARMGPADKSLFYWKSPDGSRALVWSSLKSYAWGAVLGLHYPPTAKSGARFQKEVAEVRTTSRGPILMHFGSDLWAPPEDLIASVGRFGAATGAKLRVATPVEYFRRAQPIADIPEVSGEIPSSWPNLVPSWPHVWPQVVPAVNTLLSAEKFAAFNYALGYADYPQHDFDRLWKLLLESLDHNQDGQGGLAGDLRKIEYQQQATLQGGQILRDMLRNIAERVQIPAAGSFPIVVFNPLGWTRDDLVRTHAVVYGEDNPGHIEAFRKGMRLVDESGTALPFYEEQSSSNISRAMEIVFVARGVPGLGYKTYYLIPAERPEAFLPTAEVRLDEVRDRREPRRPLGSDVIENTFFRLSVDKATGRATLFDKALGRDVCRDLEISALEERGGNYIGIEPPSGRVVCSLIDNVAIEENNAVRAVICVHLRIADILIVQRLTLYRELRRLDIENTVDWKSPRYIRVRQAFPLIEPTAAIHYGVPFGANAADNIVPNTGPHLGDEITPESWRQCRFIQDWIHAGGPEWGLTIAADHQLVRLEGASIIGEMVRGTRFTSARVVHGEEIGSLHYPPPGAYVFRYSLSTATGDWKAARAHRAGMGWNNRLLAVAVADAGTTKSLPPTRSFCALKQDNLVISAIKKADQGPDLLLRMYEIHGTPFQTQLEFLGRTATVSAVNLLEEDLDGQPGPDVQGGPYAIKTVRLRSAAH